MVKFGRHVQAFLENEHQGSDLYVVPYTDIRDLIEERKKKGSRRRNQKQRPGTAIPVRECWSFLPSSSSSSWAASAERFECTWRRALRDASDDFDRATKRMWRRVFDAISSNVDSRGALPDAALKMYIQSSEEDACHEMLSLLKMLHSTALTNAEALRKLVKKFDKGAEARGDEQLSPVLLPEVYSASLTVGIATLEAATELFRASLGMDDDYGEEDDHIDVSAYGGGSASPNGGMESNLSFLKGEDPSEKEERTFLTRRKPADNVMMDGRLAELRWLADLVESIPPSEVGKIVSHRGFHWPSDRSDTRPIENSLQAYEAAWTSGVHLCECDVALTRDERIILCHDETFSRLALDPSSPMAQAKVRDLTLRQLMSIPLKTGVRPPLLFDVLRSARAIGEHAKLVVEIKPGNPEVSPALARLFLRNPDLMEHCAVVMSFDAFAMHTLRKEMNKVEEAAATEAGSGRARAGSVSIPSSMSLGDSGLRVESAYRLMSSPMVIQRKSAFANNGGSGRCGGGDEKKDDELSHLPRANGDVGRSSGEFVGGRTLPKLMLLTVSEPPDIPCKLYLDILDESSPLDSWLRAEDGSLDGVYMQFQKSMLTEAGSAALQSLARRYDVGVWEMVGKDPDDYETFRQLVGSGVSYVNSALPKMFRKRVVLNKAKRVDS